MTGAVRIAGGKAQQIFGIRLAFVGLGLLLGSEALAHPGGLNAQGCHNNRKTGDYHCHRPQPVAQPIAEQLVMSEASTKGGSEEQGVAPPPAQQLRTSAPGKPVCHVGPRGGTYTITSSGRKNYSGC